MSDIEINIGYIDRDIIALCDDHEGSYAFYAEYLQDQNIFLSRMSSSHGLITTGRFNTNVNARQMIMIAMAKHIDVLNQKANREKAVDPGQIPADRGKVH